LRTIEWIPEQIQVRMIDQRLLPRRLEYIYCQTVEDVTDAIRTMTIRGAPALGVAGAYGMVLAAFQTHTEFKKGFRSELRFKAKMLVAARPTAVNLEWGVTQMLRIVDDLDIQDSQLAERLLQEANRLAEEDVHTNLLLSEVGASLIDDGDTIIHHCNTGSLAVVEWGTALGAIRFAHEHGKRVHLLVDETRPRLQGSRLTAWECEQYGIPYEIITDNAAGHFLKTGKVQKVFFGADRVAANGDVANKIGTYMLSLAAHANHIPVICVCPLSTIDMNIASGDLIPIEERSGDEVLNIEINGEAVSPSGAKARNPAFDITPHELITAFATEVGIIRPPFARNLASLVYNTKLDG
jgi:methylthioribose-1-phosphate isomerase